MKANASCRIPLAVVPRETLQDTPRPLLATMSRFRKALRRQGESWCAVFRKTAWGISCFGNSIDVHAYATFRDASSIAIVRRDKHENNLRHLPTLRGADQNPACAGERTSRPLQG